MNNLTHLFDRLTSAEQNNLMKSYLSEKVASLIHKTLHDKYLPEQAKEEIDNVINSEITNNLSDSAKKHFLTMCNKALEIVQLNI